MPHKLTSVLVGILVMVCIVSGLCGCTTSGEGTNLRKNKNDQKIPKYPPKMMAKEFHANIRRNNIAIPVLTYHSIHPNQSGHYTLSPQLFEDRIRSFSQKGYHFIDTVELSEYLNNKGVFPEKPVLVTFDDGYQDNYTYAYPVLRKYQAKATIFLIGDYINVRPEFLNWTEVKEMASSNLVSFQCHTWKLHHHIKDSQGKAIIAFIYQKEKEKDADYIKRLEEDLIKDKTKIQSVTN